ncbi:iron-sulfur cluster assembly accessory protein [Pseudovibrio sp. Ad37]|uniref:HesB/IscA family protein n=1 Tax=Pseudovibrio sp. Ad37 TaxID=989422 RepID=UPI0007AECE13|nr:iron-sulfur cluster assembly accessory protein [Pseudovibrio sp. Ad37]KZL23626.1 Iron-binding protein IscA [Pseudovibrio sp. Ad37]
MASGFQVLSLTDEAAEYIRTLLDASDADPLGLRVAIKTGGCAGMEYELNLVTEAKSGDDVVEDKGVKVFVDPAATLYLLGTEMGFETTKFRSGFTFKNPNEVSACGCGESVELLPADLSKFAQKN